MIAARARSRAATLAIAAALACSPRGARAPAEAPADACDVVDPASAAEEVDVERLCDPPIIRFAKGSAELDAAARCELTQVAACLISQDRGLLVKAHTARDEVATEEAAIALADQRLRAVRALFDDLGVPLRRTNWLAVGPYEASERDNPAEQRIEMFWTSAESPTTCEVTVTPELDGCCPDSR